MGANLWTGGDLPTFVTHLECSLTGELYPADTLQTLSRAGRPLLVRYDLDGVRRAERQQPQKIRCAATLQERSSEHEASAPFGVSPSAATWVPP
jgi:hypothetical protein